MKESETRPKIKFSHFYKKFASPNLIKTSPGKIAEATLLEVITVKLEDLSQELLEYDTAFAIADDHSKLPKKGKYLLLLFLFSYEKRITTTLRPAWPPNKEKFYRDNIGKIFDIILEEI